MCLSCESEKRSKQLRSNAEHSMVDAGQATQECRALKMEFSWELRESVSNDLDATPEIGGRQHGGSFFFASSPRDLPEDD